MNIQFPVQIDLVVLIKNDKFALPLDFIKHLFDGNILQMQRKMGILRIGMLSKNASNPQNKNQYRYFHNFKKMCTTISKMERIGTNTTFFHKFVFN
jgi:hypothetical protein